MARAGFRERREAARAVRRADAAFPGAFSSWRDGLARLLRSRAAVVAVLLMVLVQVAVFATGLAGDHRAVAIAVRAFAWVVVTISVLRGPVLGERQLLALVVAATLIVAATTLPQRLGIAGALVGAFLGCVPALLWRGVPIAHAARDGFMLLVRRLAGAVGVFVVGVLLPTAIVVAIVAWSRAGGRGPDLTHAGVLASTLVSTLMTLTIGPMYASMAEFLAAEAAVDGAPAPEASVLSQP